MSSDRPGAWVPDVGWVALGSLLDEGDVWAFTPGHAGYQNSGWTLAPNRPVIVVRWSDGSEPQPPEQS